MEPEENRTPYRRIRQEQAFRAAENVKFFFFAICASILTLSGILLLFLALARKELFSAIDPNLWVTPFLGYTLAIPCAVLSMVFTALYAHSRSSRLIAESSLPIPANAEKQEGHCLPPSPAASWSRIWLYPAAAFGTLAVILFLCATACITYLIIL